VSTTATVIVVLAALWVGWSAVAVLARLPFVVDNIRSYGVPESWWTWLGLTKMLGAAGLLVGLAVPEVGIAAAIGLGVYFTGAVITVLRAHQPMHVPFPLLYGLPALAAGWLIAAA